jgi:hypothetical protein
MQELAQAVAAIYLREPNQARRSPSSYFRPKTHSRLFSVKFDIGMYAVCAQIRKKAEQYLRSVEPDKSHRNNLLYYVMMTAALMELKVPKARPKTISKIKVTKMNDERFASALSVVLPIYNDHGSDDKAAKGADFISELKEKLQSMLIKKTGRSR